MMTTQTASASQPVIAPALLSPSLLSRPSDDECWQAMLTKDPAMEGRFYCGVLTTGVFCRSTCPARRPLRQNVRFFATTAEAAHAGLRPCLRCHPLRIDHGPAVAPWVEKSCRWMEQHLDDTLSLQKIASEFGLSPFHFQRTFKSVLGVSPREFMEALRLKKLKAGLKSGLRVVDAMVDAGYGSSSRLYEKTNTQLGMTPTRYRAGAEGVEIRGTTVATPLGLILLGATAKGVCFLQFGQSDGDLESAIATEFPGASIVRDDAALAAYVEQLQHYFDNPSLIFQLPLDVAATAFQRKVWNYLQTIPPGETRSYREVAEAVGHAAAHRAVANACANNQVALAVPCHRVVRTDGSLGGYRWGVERKKDLLEREKRGSSESE